MSALAGVALEKPGRKAENWRYTPLHTFEAGNYRSLERASESDFPGIDAEILIVDGFLLRAELPAEVELEIDTHPPAVTSPTPFSTWAQQRPGGFATLRVRAGNTAQVRIRHLSATEHSLASSALSIVVEDGAQLRLDEHFECGGPKEVCWIPMRRYEVGEMARLELFSSVASDAPAWLFRQQEVQLDRGSTFCTLSIERGGHVSRTDLRCKLARDAYAAMHAAFDTASSATAEHAVIAEHCEPNAMSRMRYRMLAKDRSRSVFRGKVHVHPGAAGTDARQDAKGLPLDLGSEIVTKPDLEIYADEVACQHGASVGQLEPNQLFYLQSRGLAAEVARAMLVKAFLADALEIDSQSDLRAAGAALLATGAGA